MKIFVLENDGHNWPTMHVFMSEQQALDHIAGTDPDDIAECRENLFEGGEWQDPNCVSWLLSEDGGVPTVDHDEEE